MLKKLTNKIIALLLCLITATGYVIATGTAKIVSAEDEEDYSRYDEDELSSYLEDFDIGEYEYEEESERLHSKYDEYVEMSLNDEGTTEYLTLKETPLQEYCRDYIDCYYDDEEYSTYECLMNEFEMNDEILDNYNLYDYEEDVKDEWVINSNIKMINNAVDEGFGYIEDGELILYEEDFYAARSAGFYKSFSLKWYKVYIELNSKAAIAVSFGFLLVNVLYDIRSLNQMKKELEKYAMSNVGRDTTEVEYIVNTAKKSLSEDIVTRIVSFFESDIVEYITAALFDIFEIVNGIRTVDLILKIVFRYFIPSISDCLIVMINAFVYEMGMSLNICWFRWKEKIGTTVKSIWF